MMRMKGRIITVGFVFAAIFFFVRCVPNHGAYLRNDENASAAAGGGAGDPTNLDR